MLSELQNNERELFEKASEFARSWGFDGVLPDETLYPGVIDRIPDGYLGYQAGYNMVLSSGQNAWTTLFDNTFHVIIASDDDVRWRTDDDFIDMRNIR